MKELTPHLKKILAGQLNSSPESVQKFRDWLSNQGVELPPPVEIKPVKKHRRGLGDTISRMTSAVGIAPCGGCKKRAATLNHYFPSKHLPPVEPVQWQEPIVKNLIYHIWPVKGFGTWQWNLDQVLADIDQFNGKRIIAIVTDNQTDSAQAVKDYAGAGFEFLEFPNRPTGEVVTFPSLLERVESLNPNEVTFYGHAKGVKHKKLNAGMSIQPWVETMYETVYRNWTGASDAMRTHAMAGSFLRNAGLKAGEKRKKGNFLHYSGTFFWFRNRDVFQRNWRYVPKQYGGVERWPGIMFHQAEIACLFGEGAGNLYDLNYWKIHVHPELEKWRADRGSVSA